MKTIHVLGGGTFSHVRNHFASSVPAFGGTARYLMGPLGEIMFEQRHVGVKLAVQRTLTKMADHTSKLVTNQDVSDYIDRLIDNPETAAIVMSIALCDYDGQVGDVPSGPHAERLLSRDGPQIMHLTPAPKLIGKIRQQRPDIVVVGFKTTTGKDPIEQFAIARRMLVRDNLSMVFANDTIKRHNMLVAPEGELVIGTDHRNNALDKLAHRLVDAVLNVNS